MIPFPEPKSDTSMKIPPQYNAIELTQNGNTAAIRLGDQLYILRITKAGQLILTK